MLAAQYESLALPLSIIMIVPMGIMAALTGVWLTGGDNNVFTQIGLIVLVGLSAKNAILIVEFARELELSGRSVVQAAVEASRLRLRPILMTSMAFIMGVVPLVTSTGAGAEMRSAMGIAVFAGMIGVTAFGIFMTPVFYVLIRKLSGERPLKHAGARIEARIWRRGITRRHSSDPKPEPHQGRTMIWRDYRAKSVYMVNWCNFRRKLWRAPGEFMAKRWQMTFEGRCDATGRSGSAKLPVAMLHPN